MGRGLNCHSIGSREAKYSAIAFLLGTTFLVGMASMAWADFPIWTGSVSSDWFDLNNWSPATLPGNQSQAAIRGPNPAVIQGRAAVAANVDVTGASGQLSILNGGSLTSDYGSVGYASGNGSAIIDGAGSSWIVNGPFTAGAVGTGMLTVRNLGGVTVSGTFTLGLGQTGAGVLNAESGAYVGISGGLIIGDAGRGTVNVRGGAALVAGDASVGAGPTGVGDMTVEGVGSRAETDTIFVGDRGRGTLLVKDGALLKSNSGIIGHFSLGAAIVDGQNAEWRVANYLSVGDAGTGSLKVQNQAMVSVGLTASIGSASQGAVIVDGAQSILRIGQELNVGYGARGDLTVSNGGRVVSDATTLSGTVGAGAGGRGFVTIDGPASAWINAGTLQLGLGGEGTMTLRNGGGVSAPLVSVGVNQNSIGILNIGADPGAAAATPGILDTPRLEVGLNGYGRVNFNHTSLNYVFAPSMSGSGELYQYRGTTSLAGDSAAFGGVTRIFGGTLAVDGRLGGIVQVQLGGTLTGAGELTGRASVLSGGMLAGRSGQTLSIDTLFLFSGATVNVSLAAPGSIALFKVANNLTMAGTLNVTDAGGFGAGVYRIFDYGGTLTDNGLAVGSMPGGTSGALQTAINHQVNLVVTGSVADPIQFWNGTTTAANGTVNGGSGTWTAATGTNWTDANGARAQAWGGNLAVFQNNAGTVTIDGSAGVVKTTGMQFIGQGWMLSGDALTLAGANGETVVRVGDGSAAGASSSATIASSLAGSSRLIKDDLGTLFLTGNSSAFVGGASVRAGTLSVTGTLGGSLDVLSGGRLQGTGTVGSTAVSGTVAPGNSIGTLTVAGNIVFNPASIYEVEVNAAGQGDRIHATGIAAMNGGLVRVLAGAGNYALSTRYTIVTSDGGRTGAFSGVTSNFAFLDPSLSYDSNNAYLTLTRNNVGFGDVGQTRNQIAAGGAVDSLGSGNPIWAGVVQLDIPTARRAFDQLSGEIHASGKSALIEDSHFVRDAAADRIRSAFGAVAASSAPVMAYGQGGPVPSRATAERPLVWGQGFGAWGHINGDGNAARLQHATGGLLMGLDAPVFDTWRLGFLAGYSRTSFSARDRASSGASDNYHLGIYGGTQWGDLGLRAGLVQTWHDIDISRAVSFPGFGDSLRSRYGARTFQAFGDLGYRFDTTAGAFEPFASLAFVSLVADGFTERGGAGALRSDGQTASATFATLGLRASTTLDLGGIRSTARGSLGWRHVFGDTTPLSAQGFATGDAFTIAGVPIARDAVVVETGLDMAISRAAALGVAYNGQFASSTRQHAFKANLIVRF